jgi:integrase
VTPDARLFTLGRNFVRAFNLDIATAGITKRDAQGRTVDVHCLRHTFATLLARNGVMPATAQRLMRHSEIRLTMNTYTHLDLADTAGAVAALPTL